MATATRTALTQLTEFAAQTYGVPALHTRILVSAYLPTRYPPLWLMVDAEKCNFVRDLETVLIRLEHSGILDTYNLRDETVHLINKWVKILLDTRESQPHLYANRYWDWPGPVVTPRSQYPLVAAECVRLRLEFDASKHTPSSAKEELLPLVRQAIAQAAVDKGGIVPCNLDETFYRRASILPLVDRNLSSRTALMRNFGFVIANHAALCGRTTPNEDDLQVQRYVLRHTIPLWIEQILHILLERGVHHSVAWRELIRLTGLAYQWQWHWGGQNINRPSDLGERIIKELWMTGLCERNKDNRYLIKPQYSDDLEHILEARA